MLKKTLLVIDDDKTILTALRMLMEDEYHVYTAKNGAEGLELVRDKQPDLVLLDIGLPDTNGMELIEQIKNADPRIVVIMMTAVEDAKTVVKALKLGAHDYLVKPVGARELKNALRNALAVRLRKESSENWSEGSFQACSRCSLA